MSDALKNLAQALSSAAPGDVTLTADWLSDAMKDPAVGVPAGFDTAIAKAFGTPEGSGLAVTLAANSVGPVGDDGFSVPGAGLTLLGHKLDDAAVLTFETFDDKGKSLLGIKVTTDAEGFEWAWLGEAASAKPFSVLPLQDVVLTFDAAEPTAGAIQSLVATIAPPDKFKPIVQAVEELDFPTLALDIMGSMDFTDVDGASVFLPQTELIAPFPDIGARKYTLGTLQVGGPSFGVSITDHLEDAGGDRAGAMALPDPRAVEDGDSPAEPVADNDAPPVEDQMSSVFFFVTLQLDPERGEPVVHRLTATLSPFTETGQYFFTLASPPDDDSALFTPETAIRLIGAGSFFEGTPPQLQQFLGGIRLRSLSLNGSTEPEVTLTTIGVTIGADPRVIGPDRKFVLLGDPPPGKAVFAISDFELDWSAKFGEKTEYSYLVSTEFILMPEIFRATDDLPDGVFEVEITSTYVITASFDGRASVEALFKEIAGIDVGSTFHAGISDIKVAIDVPQSRYSFDARLDALLDFGPDDGNPIFSLTDGQLNLVAATPRDTFTGQKTGKTAYGGSFMGLVNVGPIHTSASVVYDNTALSGKTGDPDWKLKIALAQPVDMRAVIAQYFDPGGGFSLPDFFQVDLTVKTVAFDAVIPTATDAKMTYTLTAGFAWDLALGSLSIASPDTSLQIDYDGKQPKGSQYSGKISAITYCSFLSGDVELSFAFKKNDQQQWDNTLAFTWAGLTSTYATQADTLTFSLKNWSLGSLLTEMVKSITGDPYFALSSPWDLLNKIQLDGLSLTMHLDAKPDAPSITAKYTLPDPIDLGFIRIEELIVTREAEKVNLSLVATIAAPLQSIVDSDPDQKKKWDKLLGKSDDKKGQPVDDLPSVPGKGNDYFNMPVLVLGQRVGIAGSATFANTKAVIDALSGKNTPSTTGDQNPVSSKSDPGSPAGTPYYEVRNNWLIATHLQLLKTGEDWTVDLMVVFADPDLYGLRLALAGEKAKFLGNLVVDILYKKITEDVGLYQIEFTFPDSIRNINVGQFSIVLPQLGIKIYTNGDFVIDVGFPYDMDFMRSFSISTIIFVGPIPIPLTGAAGFYFGKLGSAAATQVPATNLGTFEPVVIFGFGMQMGLGYNFIKGPLKAGFSLTVFGIVEGVIATWNPYNGKAIGDGNNLHDNYYFKVSGTVGIIGLLYGEIKFAIISASLNIRITLSITLTYESYQPIPIMVRATVDVSLKVKVDLGIFSFTISLSFSADVSTRFVIQTGGAQAPWIEQGQDGDAAPVLLFDLARAAEWEDAVLIAAPKTVLRDGPKPKLSLIASPQFTVMSDEAATDPASARGAFVALLAIDAPDPTAEEPLQGTSFETLVRDLLPWVVDALRGAVGDRIALADQTTAPVTDDDLTDWIKKLSNLAHPPLSFSDYLAFLSSFDVDITVPQTPEQGDKFQNGAALFPMFDGLGITWDRDGATIADVELSDYALANETYRSNIAALFEKLTAKVGEEAKRLPPPTAGADPDDEPSISMAAFVFVDAFNLLARQLLSSAQMALRDYRYPLSSGNSMDDIINGVNAIAGNDVQVDDVVQANLPTVLGTGVPLTFPVLVRVVQSGQLLDQVLASFAPAEGASLETLLVQNAGVMAVLPGQSLTLNDTPITTSIGATFASVARAAGFDGVAQLATVSGLSDMLALRPGAVLRQGGLTYATRTGDTLAHIGDTFAVDATDLFDPTMTGNRRQSPLFDSGQTPDVAVPGLAALGLADIWASIVADDQIPQMAGMLTRFMIYGMRLPSAKTARGLTLSDAFLYPRDQDAYGLYQLVGQQVPVPDHADGDSLSMTLSRADSVGSVNLDFITFNGAAGTSGPALDLSDAYGRLATLVSYTQDGKFVPEPGYEMLSPSQRRPREFSIQSSSNWSAADAAALKGVTGDTSAAPADPVIWSLPDALTNAIGQRQYNLARRFSDPDDAARDKQLRQQMFAFLPIYQPTLSSTDPGTGHTRRTQVADMAWVTRVSIRIRTLPPSPNPAGTDALSGVTYEIIGASPEEALLLERSLSALDALGKSMISGAFLAYEDKSTGSPRLATPATKDYVAFVTQTNLSTETNPAVGAFEMLAVLDDEMPLRGIANAPSDLVKLLWEQSTVRSGGYYLTWRDLPSGTGLPDAIFDEDGSAELTLVVTYDAMALAGRMTNFINAFVTTSLTLQTGTRLSVVGQHSIASKPPLAADDSLESLSEVFGVGVGPISETNATAPLAEALLPIQGAIHLVSRAEAYDHANKRTPAEILDILANKYGDNSDPALTGSDIAAVNPDTTVDQGAALFIPTILRRTAAGDTLGGIATYYGIGIDQVAVSAAAVGGIFGAGPISIDSLTYDVQGGGGDANISFEITRRAYPAPTDPSDPDYARDYMFSLYDVVSAGLAGNHWFAPNDNALPFGPQDKSGGDQGATRSVRDRRRMLAAKGQVETLTYRQSLNVANSAKLDAGTAPDIGGLENPYIGVGALAQLSLEWRDIFGNTTVTPWRNQPEDYPYAKNGQPVPVLYADRLIPMGSWPNLKSSYVYAAQSGGAQLRISLGFEASAYEETATSFVAASGIPDWQQRARADLSTYLRIWWQLNQDYKGENLPWINGPGVTGTLRNSFTGGADEPLTDADWISLRSLLNGILTYLHQRANGASGTAPGGRTLTREIAFAEVSGDNVIPLSLSIAFERPALLVEPVVAGLVNGHAVRSPILPKPDDGAAAGTSSYEDFAFALEDAFKDATGWSIRTGSGVAAPDETVNGRLQTFFALRMRDAGQSAGEGIHYTIGDQPGFFAPKPLSKSLVTGTYSVLSVYDPSEPSDLFTTQRQITLTGVDPNVMFDNALKAIDSFLSPAYAVPAFLLQADGTDDPLTSGALGDILAGKQLLADAIASTNSPILSNAPTAPEVAQSATEKLRQALLNELAPAYEVSAVVGFDVTAVGGVPDGPAGPATLFGQPGRAKKSEASVRDPWSFSTARFGLGSTTQTSSGMAFLFNTANKKAQSYVGLDLDVTFTHLEHDRRHVPGIKNYVQSSWISLITGPIVEALADGDRIDIPVVRRALPEPPTMQGQSATASNTEPATPKQLAEWDFAFDYLYHRAAQDTALISTGFNRATDAPLRGSDPVQNMTQQLVQFETLYPQVAKVLDTTLAGISVEDATNSGSPAHMSAATAVFAFARLVTELSEAFDAWVRPQPLFGFASQDPLPQTVCEFELVLSPDPIADAPANSVAKSEIFNLTLNGFAATYDPQSGTVSATGPDEGGQTFTLPLPRVDIPGYTSKLVAPYAETALAAWAYQPEDHEADSSGTDDDLIYEKALGIPQRTICYTPLNLFVYQDAWAAIRIERNKYLTPAEQTGTVSTTREFMFQSPQVQFADPAIPELSFGQFDLDTLTPTEPTTAGYLNTFFAEATDGAMGAPFEVAMEAIYSYALSGTPDLPRTVLPVSYLPPADGVADGSGAPGAVLDLAAFVDAWRAETDVTEDGAATMGFGMKVFSGAANGSTASKQPILSVGSMTLTATRTKP
ncbi:MAG: hypothetical protein LC676_00950 [Loktanella sp.]|nr:hypothetical protein [Loktanella sp.]